MTVSTSHPTARCWAEQVLGAKVTSVTALTGGYTSTMLRLGTDGGPTAVLRLMTKDPWRRHAAGLLARESDVLALLRRSAVPAPASIAVDPTGAIAGEPAHLMSFVPGEICLSRSDDEFLAALAELLHRIHRFDPGAARPRDYQSWAPPVKRVVPSWTTRASLWEKAFEVLSADPPPYRPTFLHRDFHVGNILWSGGQPCGVVDWVETSMGPAQLDVAHCATYLAMLHGAEVAHRFMGAYDAAAGRGASPPRPDRTYWHVMDVVGYLPDPDKVTRPWLDRGTEVSGPMVSERLESRLAAVLGG